ncbi:uncharacterized protein [Arachis hypogaea]|uniref:uncharacterized protein n=1 Tax=Arachis hypogaea TaxID=3818 RepID=UPI000DEC6138|nr:uncharacterized protein LOC112773298 [Arachis hypogaea]
MTVVAPLEIRIFFELVIKARVMEDCAKKVRTLPQGRVFAVNTSDASKADLLMRSKCLFGEKTLVALYDTRVAHSFIAFDKVEELRLRMSELAFDLHVHTLYQTVVTRSGCRQISFNIEDRNFVHDLICLSMVELEMILGFN